MTLTASVSPLLTFAYLWQVKEWRIDRLREHLRSECFFRQTFGFTRPLVLGFFGFFPVLRSLGVGGGYLGYLPGWHLLTLATFLAISLLQIILRRHPKPVWTKKAITLCSTSLIITLLILIQTTVYNFPFSTFHFPLFPVIQPFFLALSVMLWKPIDQFLKKRIMNSAKRVRSSRSNLTVIGITGSVGKSTTKELLSHILKNHHLLSTPEHVNTEMGVSQWLIRELPKNPEAEILIVEMGAYHTGEIALLCDIVKPTMGVVTFIGKQHIGLFGSQEALCKAKGELIEAIPEDGFVFLNADSKMCNKLKDVAKCSVVTVGTGGPIDLEAFEIEETAHGIEFRVSDTGFFIPIHGTHNVSNVLLATAIAQKLDMNLTEIAEVLKSYRPATHTFAMRKHNDVMILDDTHNSSPASFKAALEWSKSQPFEYKTLLTSGLIELGMEQDRIHSELGALSSGIFDRVVFLNKKSARNFSSGYGREVETLSKHSNSIPETSLLVCVGRMSEKSINQLIPKNSN